MAPHGKCWTSRGLSTRWFDGGFYQAGEVRLYCISTQPVSVVSEAEGNGDLDELEQVLDDISRAGVNVIEQVLVLPPQRTLTLWKPTML